MERRLGVAPYRRILEVEGAKRPMERRSKNSTGPGRRQFLPLTAEDFQCTFASGPPRISAYPE